MTTRGTRFELAAVAAALLLPIPLFVASGLRLPLPAAVERGLASLESGGGFDSAVIEAPPVALAPDADAVATGSPGTSAVVPGRRAASSTTVVVETRDTPDEAAEDSEPGSDTDTGAGPSAEPGPEVGPPAPPGRPPLDPARGDTGGSATVPTPAGPIDAGVDEQNLDVVVPDEPVVIPVPEPPAPDVPLPEAPPPLPPLPPPPPLPVPTPQLPFP